MKKFWTLFKYEIGRLLVSPSTYVFFLIFATALGSIFAFLLHNYIKFAQDVPFVQMFFRCFWLPTCIVVPLITMRSFSEEYKSGTLQSLFSVPISSIQIVFAKFLAAYLMFIVLWLCSLVILSAVGFDTGSLFLEVAFVAQFNMIGSISFICLIGLFFVAVGILSSVLTENQIISSMVTFFILMTCFIGGQFSANMTRISNFSFPGTYSELFNIFSQLDSFCNGVIDSRVIVFYVSSCILTLCLSTILVQRKLN
jgi:ABC-2 type transport system permease protein